MRRRRRVDFIIDILFGSMKGAKLVSEREEQRECLNELSERLEEVERKLKITERLEHV